MRGGNLNGRTGGTSVAAVPEPATWAMMMVGFAVVGAMLRGLVMTDRRLATLSDAPEA